MAMTRSRNRSRYVVAILLLAALTLITLDARSSGNGALRAVRNVTHTALTPIQSGIHTALRPVGNFLTGAADYGSLKAENARLRGQLQGSASAASRARFDQVRADQVLALAHLKFADGVTTVTAAVTSQASSNFETTITLSRGTSSGVAFGQPVVSAGGLVGSITSVSASSSTVTLVTDPTFVCGVALPSANVGTASGQGEGEDLKVSVIPNGTAHPRLRKGDQLSTSDLGGSFPSGVPVGSISSVSSPGGGSNPTASVEPAVNTASLTYVDVMLWSPQ